MIYGWIFSLQRLIFPLFLTIALSACGGGAVVVILAVALCPHPRPRAPISL